jgi:hypothetical protein
MSGKGSRRRPSYVSDKEFASRWDAAFGTKRKRKKARKIHPWDALVQPGPPCKLTLKDLEKAMKLYCAQPRKIEDYLL